LERTGQAVKKPKPAYTWRVTLIRSNGRSLGTVKAPDEQTAIARAAEEFQLSPEQKKRVVVQRTR
jgi:hypothetical protein